MGSDADCLFPQPELATSAIILAIDLGKFNSVICAFDPDTREASSRTVVTLPAVRPELLRQPVVSANIEACSPAGWAHDLCEELRARVSDSEPARAEPAPRLRRPD